VEPRGGEVCAFPPPCGEGQGGGVGVTISERSAHTPTSLSSPHGGGEAQNAQPRGSTPPRSGPSSIFVLAFCPKLGYVSGVPTHRGARSRGVVQRRGGDRRLRLRGTPPSGSGGRCRRRREFVQANPLPRPPPAPHQDGAVAVDHLKARPLACGSRTDPRRGPVTRHPRVEDASTPRARGRAGERGRSGQKPPSCRGNPDGLRPHRASARGRFGSRVL